ncbi:DNA-binding protein HEXBP-like [Aricia agestis]|uniref:DNA-binding protein HEXBP-like n=1 Tax=Aricia agestis TaxID=91739 RepID=UPI001C2058A5|nr:DNA-binding protein HEXBP-like [Aricia agestis]
MAAAKKLMASGRLQVGWVMTKVVLLAARPTRCYRCLDTGHLAPNCQSLVDRSGNCFRCGKPGHKATDCAEKLRCFLCVELGKESNYVLGSNGCITVASKSPGTKNKRKARLSRVSGLEPIRPGPVKSPPPWRLNPRPLIGGSPPTKH